MNQAIINYLRTRYQPLTIAVYGSYAEGTFDAQSDFDCLVIVKDKTISHDDSMIEGILLDCFIYSEAELAQRPIEDFLTLYDAILLEDNGSGAKLKQEVRDYVLAHRMTAPADKDFLKSWMKKVLRRMEKGDDEAHYRAVMLLAESLEDYFTLRDQFYFGSKKAIKQLETIDPLGYALFHQAMSLRTDGAIRSWIDHVMRI